MKKAIVLALSSSLLIACGGGGGGSSLSNGGGGSASSVGGIWEGTVTETGGTQYSLIAAIDENGEAAWYVSDGEMSTCTMAVSGNNFSCSPENGYVISGTVDERNTITGRARVNGTQTSTFTANFNDLYNVNSSLTKVADIWSDSEGAYTETYTIDADGDITGNDTDGCVFTGSVDIIDTDFNMYDLEMTVSNCGEANGTYTGKAILDRTTEDEDTLTSYLSNGEYAIAGDIYRQ